MTQNVVLNNVANEIETLSADLLKVNALIDILGQPAIRKASEINRALKDAKERFATALANEQESKRQRELGQFTDISVIAKAEQGANLLSTTFTIRYTRLTWDITARVNVPVEHECNGFLSLDDTAHDYLMTVKPHAIPAQIMALAPGNPKAAMGTYFTGLRRGYFVGSSTLLIGE